MSNLAVQNDPSELARRWRELSAAEPRLRARDAALRLGVSEAQLVATRCGHGATRLRPEWPALLAKLGSLGPILALTRNEGAVHELDGPWSQASFRGPMGIVQGGPIDLRLFLQSWHSGYALLDEVRPSLQFFDAAGAAIHKVHARAETNLDALRALAQEFAAADQSASHALSAPAPRKPERSDAEIDRAGLQAAWLGLKDTHEFYPLLQRFGVSRVQALRLAPADHAWRVAVGAAQAVLESASTSQLPIMVFVGNQGAIQIFTGSVRRVSNTPGWLNVLDAGFNLHLREDSVAASWLVRKPTRDGDVHALELYDEQGELVVQFFGARKPGREEQPAWRALASGLPRLS